MVLLFTDFGLDGPYQGQMKAVLAAMAPSEPVIDLMADVPAFRVQEASYLLAALLDHCPGGGVVLAVVDPGVGGARPAVAVRIGGRWLVGPGNGLFEPLARRQKLEACFEIVPEPGATVSASFHGRDLFAPAAARLSRGEVPSSWRSMALPRYPDWPDDLPRVVYVDRYGNVMTGVRAAGLSSRSILSISGEQIERQRTFSDVPPGSAFWYENSCGLVEIAVNQGNAAEILGLQPGSSISITP